MKVQKSLIQFKSPCVFLSSILRNSLKSKYAYESALAHFQRFLVTRYMEYNIETILGPLSRNEINVHTVLDEFVSYLLNVNANLTPNSVNLYVAAIAYYDIDVVSSKFKRKVKMPKVYREDDTPSASEKLIPRLMTNSLNATHLINLYHTQIS